MDETRPATPQHVPEPRPQKPKNRGLTIGLIVGTIVLILALAAAVWALVTHPTFTAAFRDVAIIALALVTIIIGLSLVVLVFQLQSLIALLRDEIRPILDSANQTVSTVRGTTSFLSETVVTPAITAASYAAAVRQAASVLIRGGRKKGTPKSRGLDSSEG